MKNTTYTHTLYSTNYKGEGKLFYSEHKRLDLAEKAMNTAKKSKINKNKDNNFKYWIEEN